MCSCVFVSYNISLKQTQAAFGMIPAQAPKRSNPPPGNGNLFLHVSSRVWLYWLRYQWTALQLHPSDPICWEKLGMLSNWHIWPICFLRIFGYSSWRFHKPRMPVPPRSAQKTWDFWPARWCFQRLMPTEKLSPSCQLPIQWPHNNYNKCLVLPT